MKTIAAIRGAALAAAALLTLTACASPAPPRYPDIRFQGPAPINLDVAEIVLENRYQPPLRAPNADHLFPVPPAKVAENWARDRLRAVGSSGRAVAIVENGSVVMEDLKKTGGIKGAFTTDQTERYTARVAMRIEVSTAGGLGKGFAEASAERVRTVAENASLNEREQTWYDMTRDLAADFDREMTRSVQQHLQPFIK